MAYGYSNPELDPRAHCASFEADCLNRIYTPCACRRKDARGANGNEKRTHRPERNRIVGIDERSETAYVSMPYKPTSASLSPMNPSTASRNAPTCYQP